MQFRLRPRVNILARHENIRVKLLLPRENIQLFQERLKGRTVNGNRRLAIARLLFDSCLRESETTVPFGRVIATPVHPFNLF